MLLALLLIGAVTRPSPDTTRTPDASTSVPVEVRMSDALPTADTTFRPRHKAIVISDAYYTRLKIHRAASYALLPIFTTQAILGAQLYHNEQHGYPPSASLKRAHDAMAVTLGALFVANSVTGSMNWWEGRHNEVGRTWRTLHAALMLASDAGFTYTGITGWRGRFSSNGGNSSRTRHLRVAELSIGTALTSYVMMWGPIRRDK